MAKDMNALIIGIIADKADALALKPNSLSKAQAAKIRLAILGEFFPELKELDKARKLELYELACSFAFGNDSQMAKIICKRIFGIEPSAKAAQADAQIEEFI